MVLIFFIQTALVKCLSVFLKHIYSIVQHNIVSLDTPNGDRNIPLIVPIFFTNVSAIPKCNMKMNFLKKYFKTGTVFD